MLGATGSWFAGGVSGRRLLSSPSECACYRTDTNATSAPLSHPIVPRIHAAVETAQQWHFTTPHVCGADGREYASRLQATRAGVDVANCGQCSKCSSIVAVDAMHVRATSLTKRASLAAVAYLFGGETVHWLLMRSGLVGFDAPCADCWLAATQCNLASCAQHCLYGWQNPLSSSPTINGTTRLNACMQCDELHCSAYFLQACGANRRTAGVVSDINRPSEHVCMAARSDAHARAASNAIHGNAPLSSRAWWRALPIPADATWLVVPTSALLVLTCLLTWLLGPRHQPLPHGHYESPRRFLLTGCASGMGRRITAELLWAGHMVMATDVSEESLRAISHKDGWSRLSREGKNASGVILLMPLDVRDPAAWDAVLRAATHAWGGLDTVLNFAGLLEPKSALEITSRSIDMHVDVMTKGVMHGTCAAARAFATQPHAAHDGLGGHVVNVSSLGAVAPVAGVSLYQAAKAGCRTFSLAAAKDLASHNVVVSVLMPDAVATPMADLQLFQDESAMAYSGRILTLDQLTTCVLEHVLPCRPMEARLGADYVRQWGAGVADAFPSSRAVAWTEASMRREGRKRQARECARRLADDECGSLADDERARLTARQQELRLSDGRGCQSGVRGSGRVGGGGWWRVVAAVLVGWALILHFGACAGFSDFAKASLARPSHLKAADLAVSLSAARGGWGAPRRHRVALVTGATSGIGRETAAALVEAGHHVIMGARSAAKAAEAVAEARARARRRGLGGTAEAVLMISRASAQ